MQEDSFIEKFRASLGDKAATFGASLEKVFSAEEEKSEIVNAPKVIETEKIKIDKEDYEILAVSWKELGASQEREEIRSILIQARRIGNQHSDKKFVDGINFVLNELDERDKNK